MPTPSVEKNFTKLALLLSIFISGLVTANLIAGVKLVALAGFVLPVGFLAYAVTFPVTDIVDEVYGPRMAQRFVLVGFVAQLLAVALVVAGHYMPPLVPEMQRLYDQALMPAVRITVAGAVAYLVSQTHDVWAFHMWKRLTRGRWLWLRNNTSTMVSQLIDTATFITLAFYGTVPNPVLLKMVVGQWVWKVVVAAADTPFVYLGVKWLRGSEQ